MENRLFTCISCPIGCEVEAKIEDQKIIDVKGNRCPRGEDYVKNEYFNPTRILPTTVRVKDGILPLVPVKTLKPIPKDLLEDAMVELAKVIVEAPVKMGQVVLQDILGTGVDVVATRDLKKSEKREEKISLAV